MIWKFVKSYKGMFWYSATSFVTKKKVIVCIYGDIYRNAMHPAYTYNDFFSTFICDDSIEIDEVAYL